MRFKFVILLALPLWLASCSDGSVHTVSTSMGLRKPPSDEYSVSEYSKLIEPPAVRDMQRQP